MSVEESGLALFAPAFLLVNGSGRISAPQESSLHSAALWYISGFYLVGRNQLMLNSQALIRCEAQNTTGLDVCMSVAHRLVVMVFTDR